MRHPSRVFLAVLSLTSVLALASLAAANAAPLPRPKGPQLVVQPNNDKVSRLSIPRKLIPALEKKAEKADATDSGSWESGRTIVAGVAISAAITLLGLQLVRRPGGRGLAPVLLVGAGVCAVLGATALADIALPGGGGRRPRPGPPPINPPGTITTPLVVEWTDQGDNAQLWISPDQLHQNAPGAAQPPPPAPNAAPK